MKRALFLCVDGSGFRLVYGMGGDGLTPMTAEVTEDERFSIVEEGETRFLRYERKQGDTWATIWENDAIFAGRGTGVDLHRQFSRRR